MFALFMLASTAFLIKMLRTKNFVFVEFFTLFNNIQLHPRLPTRAAMGLVQLSSLISSSESDYDVSMEGWVGLFISENVYLYSARNFV